MKIISILAATLVAPLSLTDSSQASIVLNIGAAELQTAVPGQLLPAGTLIQLVNLGADGVFNDISLLDGDTSQLGQWVSGDDTLITVAYTVPNGVTTDPGDFSSAAAFDLSFGADLDPGILFRAFEFATGAIPAGTIIGIRWFPSLQAADFATITLLPGQAYGQFTRQGTLINGGDSVWIVPADGANVTLDPLVTTSAGGGDPNSAGVASLTVIPEPSSACVFGLGALVVASSRLRRRA